MKEIPQPIAQWVAQDSVNRHARWNDESVPYGEYTNEVVVYWLLVKEEQPIIWFWPNRSLPQSLKEVGDRMLKEANIWLKIWHGGATKKIEEGQFLLKGTEEAAKRLGIKL